MKKEIKVFGREIIDAKCIKQLENCITEDSIGVLTADAHYGYGHPIGGAVGYKNHVSLSGVGFDIACGNYAVRTEIKAAEVNVPKVMDEIFSRISFGMGRVNNEKVDHPVLEKIRTASFDPQRSFARLAEDQLGTVGGGNHFVDLFEDESGFLWVGVHFGSRGFGHKTTTGFIALSKGKGFSERVNEGGMDSPPILFDVRTELGKDYILAVDLAGEYAYAGREIVVAKVLEILGNPAVTKKVHNHHNFVWREFHFDDFYWVVRKGCTPAFPGQLGFIGATMADTSVIIEGVDSEESRDSLYSTVHGAGRVMSRTEAAGKKKWLPDASGKKRPTVVAPGKVNFDLTKKLMKDRSVELRGAGADESPECYKRLDEVLRFQGATIKVLHRLKPIGVAMAGDETFDPYKD